MAELIMNNTYLILLLPLWIFITVMAGRFFAVNINKTLVHLLTLFSCVAGALFSGALLLKMPADYIFESQFIFIKINKFIISCGVHIDKLSLIFSLILFIISFCVILYSISHLKDEPKQYRYYALMNLFNFSMTGLFFSPNLFQTYIFWEISSVVSYLLIGFDYLLKEKSAASKRVFIINRIGDAAFLGGIIICSYLMFEYSPSTNLSELSFLDMNIIASFVNAYTSNAFYIIICGLFTLAALVKSAQVPFYNWLQDAMEAKLPVSAFLHSATLVTLGVFILIRLIPFFTLNEFTIKAIIAGGLLTAIICSLSACAQNNNKKALAYSTSAQIGLMLFAIGLLNIKAAVALFCAHALIKSMLFLTLPEKDSNWSYFGFIIFMLGGMSLAGLVFSGFISKEMLMSGLNNDYYIVIVSLISLLTAFYISRIGFKTAVEHNIVNKTPNIVESFSIAALLLFNILFYIYLRLHFEYHITEPFWAALTGFVTAYILHKKNKFYKIPLLYEVCSNGFYLEKFYTKFLGKIYSKISQMLYFAEIKIFDNYSAVIYMAKMGVKFVNIIEESIINKTISLIKNFLKKISVSDLRLQNSSIQSYNMYALLIITAVITMLVLAYSAVLIFIGG